MTATSVLPSLATTSRRATLRLVTTTVVVLALIAIAFSVGRATARSSTSSVIAPATSPAAAGHATPADPCLTLRRRPC
jgi:hypothetical protein